MRELEAIDQSLVRREGSPVAVFSGEAFTGAVSVGVAFAGSDLVEVDLLGSATSAFWVSSAFSGQQGAASMLPLPKSVVVDELPDMFGLFEGRRRISEVYLVGKSDIYEEESLIF